METQNNCPNCGKPLETNALQGLCAECLIQAGWPTVDNTGSEGDQAVFVPPSIDDLAALFPQLEIQELIGRGGMGAVYKARQPNLDRIVALKILASNAGSDPGFSERFTREARALARLNHPSIVAVFDFGHAGELSYFVMEYVDGPNLREIERSGALSPAEALEIIPQICEALQFAHDKGVVHRDIKPENVLLDQSGRVKIADFGLAKIMGTERQDFTLTEPNQVMGTPHYMAPEQVEHPRDVDHRADIYSLGVVFYEMLTGELPLGKFTPPSGKVQVDVRLDEVVLRTLEKEPDLRYQKASQVSTEVATIVSTPQSGNARQTQSHPSKRSLCYISTPDYLRTFRGRFFSIHQGKGELSLSPEMLSFKTGWQTVTMPFTSIQTLAQGTFPQSAKPLPLHYIAVTFDEHGLSRTLLFTPVRKAAMSPSEANKIGAEWLSDMIEAVRASTGRTLTVGHLDVTQDTTWWEYVKLYLFMAATSTIGFSVIPIMLKRRLPNSFYELLPGILFAIPMFFMCLTMPRWLGAFRDRSERGQSRTAKGSSLGRLLKRLSILVLIITGLLLVSLIVPELHQSYILSGKHRFTPVVERKFYHSDANSPDLIFLDLDRDVIMTPRFAAVMPEGKQLFQWLSQSSLQNDVQLNQWIKDCGIDLAMTFSRRQDAENWSWYIMGVGAERLNPRFAERPFDGYKPAHLVERETCAIRVVGSQVRPGRESILCFKTDRGKTGVLEYDGLFDGVIDGFKIRYKLVDLHGAKEKRRSNSIAATAPFIAQLSQGTVELLGICESPSEGKAWWAADGSPAEEGPFPVFVNDHPVRTSDDHLNREFVIRTQGLPRDTSEPEWQVDPFVGYTRGSVTYREMVSEPNYYMIAAALPKDTVAADLKIGFAIEPWTTVYGQYSPFKGIHNVEHLGQSWTVSLVHSEDTDRGAQLAVSHTIDPDWQFRIICDKKSHGPLSPGASRHQRTEDMTMVTATFDDVLLEDLEDFKFQVRPYEWVEFRDLSLAPGQKTPVQIQDSMTVSVSTPKASHSSPADDEVAPSTDDR